MAASAAGKAGVIGVAKVIAAEYGAEGVRANAVLPGGTGTPRGRVVLTSPEMRSFVENMHALKRMAEPEEIARSILHLASEAGSFITGTAFLVDGGVSTCRTGGSSPPRPGTAGRRGRGRRARTPDKPGKTEPSLTTHRKQTRK